MDCIKGITRPTVGFQRQKLCAFNAHLIISTMGHGAVQRESWRQPTTRFEKNLYSNWWIAGLWTQQFELYLAQRHKAFFSASTRNCDVYRWYFSYKILFRFCSFLNESLLYIRTYFCMCILQSIHSELLYKSINLVTVDFVDFKSIIGFT